MLQDILFYVILASILAGVYYVMGRVGKPLTPSMVIMAVYIIIAVTALLAIKYQIRNPLVSLFLKKIRDMYNKDRVAKIQDSLEDLQARNIKAIHTSEELQKEADALLALAKTSLENVEKLEVLLEGTESYKTAAQIHKEAVEAAPQANPDKVAEALALLSELKKRNKETEQ